MLSIIVSSYQPYYYAALEKNIAETVGVPYEIIKVDNPGIMGICEAYNTGAAKAKYQYLLFLHEDVLFCTMHWGERLLQHFNLADVGVLGFAGGDYVPAAPVGWYTAAAHAHINITQAEGKAKVRIITFKEKHRKVIGVDGVFMAVKRNIFNRYLFDENLKNFHGYDYDFSLRVAKQQQNYVISDISAEHYSAGDPNKTWFDANLYIRKKLGSGYHKIVNHELEYQMYESFVRQYFTYYPKNLGNLIRVLRFFPFFKIKKSKYYRLLKFTINA